jgi:hypothetical protein
VINKIAVKWNLRDRVLTGFTYLRLGSSEKQQLTFGCAKYLSFGKEKL